MQGDTNATKIVVNRELQQRPSTFLNLSRFWVQNSLEDYAKLIKLLSKHISQLNLSSHFELKILQKMAQNTCWIITEGKWLHRVSEWISVHEILTEESKKTPYIYKTKRTKNRIYNKRSEKMTIKQTWIFDNLEAGNSLYRWVDIKFPKSSHESCKLSFLCCNSLMKTCLGIGSFLNLSSINF